MFERIAVVGTGYVGLVSGTCYAEAGHFVIGVDRAEEKIQLLQSGHIPIYEPGLDEMVQRHLQGGRLAFTTDLKHAVRQSDIVFLAVGTPTLPNGEVDLSQVQAAVTEIAEAMAAPKLIVMKSTVPVGTSRLVEGWIETALRKPLAFDVVSNPEFLREGSAIRDTLQPDRIVIGADRRDAAERIAALHASFGAPVLYTDRESAELIKYASNAFLAAKISFINEMANVCEKVGADIDLVSKGMGMDRRIGPHFLQAGIGYGGSCFPKDTKAQLRLAEHVDYDFLILRSVIEVNRRQRERFADKIEQTLGGPCTVALMGLTFKPETDDLRDAPALDILSMLVERGFRVRAYDPVAAELAADVLSLDGAVYVSDPYEALTGADAMVVTTEWSAVRTLDLEEVKARLARPVVIDGRNCFDPVQMAKHGIRYIGVGRPEIVIQPDSTALVRQ